MLRQSPCSFNNGGSNPSRASITSHIMGAAMSRPWPTACIRSPRTPQQRPQIMQMRMLRYGFTRLPSSATSSRQPVTDASDMASGIPLEYQPKGSLLHHLHAAAAASEEGSPSSPPDTPESVLRIEPPPDRDPGTSPAESSSSSSSTPSPPSASPPSFDPLHAMADKMLRQARDQLHHVTHPHLPTGLPGGVVVHMDDQHGAAAMHVVQHRVAEKASMKFAEGLVERVVRRTVKGRLKMVQMVMARAGKVLFKRLARGLLVALPLIGALFIAQLVRADYQRLQSEREHQAEERRRNGEGAAGEDSAIGASSAAGKGPNGGGGGALTVGCFAAAFLCDLFDGVAHLVVAAGTLIPALPPGLLSNLATWGITELMWEHHMMHVAESASWGLALGALAAATAGELLSNFTAIHHQQHHDDGEGCHGHGAKPPPPQPAFHGVAPEWSSEL